MMKFLSIILFFAFLITGCNQKIYEQGLVHHNNLKAHYRKFQDSTEEGLSYVTFKGVKYTGKAIEKTYADGSAQTIREYKDGIPTGNYSSYFPGGQIELELRASPNQEFLLYDTLGTKLIHQVKYPSGKSEETLFFSDGNPKERYINKEDWHYEEYYRWNKNGDLLELYIADSIYFLIDSVSGQLLEKGMKDYFQNKQGLWTSFYEQGQTKSISFYRHGYPDGIFQSFYPNGKVETEGFYIYGNREKNWKLFFENGNLKQRLNYTNNELDGEFAEFWENGKTKISGNFISGKKSGKWRFFTISGIISEELDF